jgi:hypothetical protein
MADAQDKNKMYAEVFSDFYNYMESLNEHGMSASECVPFLHSFKFCYPSDLNVISGRGGHFKETSYFAIFVLLLGMIWLAGRRVESIVIDAS